MSGAISHINIVRADAAAQIADALGPIKVIDWLHLTDTVTAALQVAKAVEAIAGGLHAQVDRGAAAGSAGQDDRHIADAALGGEVAHPVVVAVFIHVARQPHLSFAKLVAAGLHTGAQVDIGNRVATRAGATSTAGCILPIGVVAGLLLDQVVGSGTQVIEVEAIVEVSRAGHQHGIASIIRATQHHGRAFDQRLAQVFEAIVIAVEVDQTAEGGLRQLAEVVVLPKVIGIEDNVADEVVGCTPSQTARRVHPIQITRRLGLGDAIGSGDQISKTIETAEVGLDCIGDQVARWIYPKQPDSSVRDRIRIVVAHPIVVAIHKDIPAQPSPPLTEVIVVGAGVAGDIEIGKAIVAGRGRHAAPGPVLSIAIATGLLLGQGVYARSQPSEAIGPTARCCGGQCHGLAEIIHPAQVHQCARDAAFGLTLKAVVVYIEVDKAIDAGCNQFAKVVVAATGVRQHQVHEAIVAANGPTHTAAERLFAIQITNRLGFGDRIGARWQVHKLPQTAALRACDHRY